MGTLVGGIVGAGIGYGTQVAANMRAGMELRQALTTDIDAGKIVRGAFVGAMAGTVIASGVGMLATGATAAAASATAGGVATGVTTAAVSDDGGAAEVAALETAVAEAEAEVSQAATGAADEAGTASIRFAQAGVSQTFRHGEFAGQMVRDVSQRLTTGEVTPDQLPVRVISREGVMYTMNNRSLLALRLAGLEPTVIVNVTGDPVFESQLTQRLQEIGGYVGPDFIPLIRGE